MPDTGSMLGGMFAAPQQQPSRVDKISAALMGFGAGVRGRGQEYLSGLRAERQQLSQDRQMAMVRDAMTVDSLLANNRIDDALALAGDRVQKINELGGDPGDTLQVYDMLRTGNAQGARQMIGEFLGQAQQAGLIPGAQTIKPSDLVDGELIQQDPLRGITRQRVADPQSTDAFRTLADRAEAAGLVPGTPEYQRFMEQGGTGSGGGLQRVSGIVSGEETPSILSYNPADGTMSRIMPDGSVQKVPGNQVTQVSVQGAAGDVLPPVRLDTLQAERDWIKYQSDELSRMIEGISSDPTLAGVIGQARRAGQQAFGAVRDLSSLFGPAGSQRASEFMMNAANAAASAVADGDMSESQFDRLFNDPALSEIALFENTLGFTLARLRSPDGRLLSPIVNQSLQDAKITGFTSSDDVIAKLSQIQNQLNSRIEGIDRRMGNDLDQSPATDLSIDELIQRYAP